MMPLSRHPGKSRGPAHALFWMPAFAGMTASALLFRPASLQATESGKSLCQKNFSDYKSRLAKNPADTEAWTSLRVCAAELKRWDEAIQVALAARQKNRDLPEPYLLMGLAQMQQKNYERAIEHFDQTISLKSDQPIAYFQMGMAYLFLNEPQKAELAAERAVELEPTNGSHHRQLAYTQLINGELSAAEASAKKAIDLDKDDLAAHKILAKIYAKEEDTVGMTRELAIVKKGEAEFALAHPELVKKPEPTPSKPSPDEEDEKESKKQEDYEIIGTCIGQWNRMREAAVRGNVSEALSYYSDYLDTRDQYKASFERMGAARLQTVFSGFGELYDCDVVFASAHCKAVVRNPAGTTVVTRIRFERNPDRVWRIRSF